MSDSSEDLLTAVRTDNVDRVAELVDEGFSNAQRIDLLQAAAQASASRVARLLLEDELKRESGEMLQSLTPLFGRYPQLADWTLMAAAASGQLDCLERLVEAAESRGQWRQLSVCLAERHPDKLLHAVASGRCPRLLERLQADAIDYASPADAGTTSAAEDEELESTVSELLPLRLRSKALAPNLTEADRQSLAKAAVATGSAKLVRCLLSLGRIRPDDLEAPEVPPPAKLVLSNHLDLAQELLLIRRRDLLHCCLDLRKACIRQLKRLSPAHSQLLSSSSPRFSSLSSTPALSPDSLRQLSNFAELVCLNAVDSTYAACPPACQPLVHHHLLRPPPSGAGASIADKAPRSLFATRCFVDLIDRRWRGGAYPNDIGRRPFPNLATPREKFLLHTAAFLLFMVFHAFYIVSLDSSWRWPDSVMVAYFISYSLQETHELIRTCRRYFTIWNLIDQLQLLFLLLGLAFKASVATGLAQAPLVYETRLMLGVSFMLCGLKFVLQLRAYRKFGPFINMMKALFWADLLPFLVAMFLFLVVCSGIFFHALLTPGNQVYTASGDLLRANQTQLYWDIYLRPLLLAFGELRYDSLAGCLSGEDTSQGCPHPAGLRAYTGGLMHVYLIVVNLLLINLLIAKFSLTVSVKDSRGFVIWRRYRYQLLREYEAINTLPPPVNAPGIIFDWICVRNGDLVSNVPNCSTALTADVEDEDEDDAGGGGVGGGGVVLRNATGGKTCNDETPAVDAVADAAADAAADVDADNRRRRVNPADAAFALIQSVALRSNRSEALCRERAAESSEFDD